MLLVVLLLSAHVEFRGPRRIDQGNIYCKVDNDQLRSVANARDFSKAYHYIDIAERQKVEELLTNQDADLVKLGVKGSKFLQGQGWVFFYKKHVIFLEVLAQSWKTIRNLKNVLEYYIQTSLNMLTNWKNIQPISGVDYALFQEKQRVEAVERERQLLQRQLVVKHQQTVMYQQGLAKAQNDLVVSTRAKQLHDDNQNSMWVSIVEQVKQEAKNLQQGFSDVSTVIEHIRNAIPPQLLEVLLSHSQDSILQNNTLPDYMRQNLAPLAALAAKLRDLGDYGLKIFLGLQENHIPPHMPVQKMDVSHHLPEVLSPPPKDKPIPKKEGKKDEDSPTAEMKKGPGGDPLSPCALSEHQKRMAIPVPKRVRNVSSVGSHSSERTQQSCPQTPIKNLVPHAACVTPSVHTMTSVTPSFFKGSWHFETGSVIDITTPSEVSSQTTDDYVAVPQSLTRTGSFALSSVSSSVKDESSGHGKQVGSFAGGIFAGLSGCMPRQSDTCPQRQRADSNISGEWVLD